MSDGPMDLSGEVEDLFKKKMLEFLKWCEANWQISEKDRQSDDWVAEKSAEYVEGYNAAIEGLGGAYECWAEEFLR
jgi:hypothetical protein